MRFEFVVHDASLTHPGVEAAFVYFSRQPQPAKGPRRPRVDCFWRETDRQVIQPSQTEGGAPKPDEPRCAQRTIQVIKYDRNNDVITRVCV
jgi:hypothetical protein